MSKEQHPTNGDYAKTFADMYAITQHPAFRLGFLDAQAGRPFDHENIMARIEGETPRRALERIGWLDQSLALLGDDAQANRVEIAQYRYEEGRLLVVQERLRCKAWGHPDYPPKAVFNFCWKKSQERAA